MPLPPRITVVTPSYNQAEFLETTLLSVLGQEYPNLEYMVMDGGSTDGSVDIIKRYSGRLAFWVSEPDGGQSKAINRAFARATGEILCWINSDDYLMPGSLRHVAAALGDSGESPALVQGHCLLFRDAAAEAWPLLAEPVDVSRLRRVDTMVQPSTFWTTELWRRTGPLDESLHFGFDWDWFVRATDHCAFSVLPHFLSGYRLHGSHKTGTGGARRQEELAGVLGRYGTPQEREQFEWMIRNPETWSALRKWADLAAMLRRNHLPEAFATAVHPTLWLLNPALNKRWLSDWARML